MAAIGLLDIGPRSGDEGDIGDRDRPVASFASGGLAEQHDAFDLDVVQRPTGEEDRAGRRGNIAGRRIQKAERRGGSARRERGQDDPDGRHRGAVAIDDRDDPLELPIAAGAEAGWTETVIGALPAPDAGETTNTGFEDLAVQTVAAAPIKWRVWEPVANVPSVSAPKFNDSRSGRRLDGRRS